MKAFLALLAMVPFLMASSPSPCATYEEPPYPESAVTQDARPPGPTAIPTHTPHPLTEPTVTPPLPERYEGKDEAERRTTEMIVSERAMGREEAVRRAMELVKGACGARGNCGREELKGHLRGLWGGVVGEGDASAITKGEHAYSSVNGERLVWVLVFEGPFVYQFEYPLRLYVAVVMSAETGAEAYLYNMGAPPRPLEVWRMENLGEYLRLALASER